MTDDEIIQRITQQLVLAALFSILNRKAIAEKFTEHSLRLIATHKDVCQRWMDKQPR